MKALTILPYKPKSSGARMLARGLRIHRMPSPDLIRGGHHVINWGGSKWQPPVACKVFNRPAQVSVAVNKLRSFEHFKDAGVNTPEWTVNPETAIGWARNGNAVVCRTLLEASEGKGAYVADKDVDIGDAKLYTRYVRKSREYRVHVAFGKVIGFKRKIKHKDVPIEGDPRLRNHAGGYRFIVDPTNPPEQCVLDEALKAIQALKLDFGGVDVMWTQKPNKAYVLEVNCAPGLTDMTTDWYVKAFKEYYGLAP